MSSRRLRYHTQPVSATEDSLRTIVDNWETKHDFGYWEKHLSEDEFMACNMGKPFSWEDLTHCDSILGTATGNAYAQPFMDPIWRVRNHQYDYKKMMAANQDLMGRVRDDLNSEINDTFPDALRIADRDKWDGLIKAFVGENRACVRHEYKKLWKLKHDDTLLPILQVYVRLLHFWTPLQPNYKNGYVAVPAWNI